VKNLKYSGIKLILEYSEFNQYQMGIDSQNPLGPGYGFASDAGLSVYGNSDGPYVDYYARLGGAIARMGQISKHAMAGSDRDMMKQYKNDKFLEDLDNFSDFKILRMFRNNFLKLDIFISFNLEDEEFFGVFKNFNWIDKPKLQTELWGDQRFTYMDEEYKLKLSNYFYKILCDWFDVDEGLYKTLKEVEVKNEMGEVEKIKMNAIVELIKSEVNKDGNPYIKLKYKEKYYSITGNDYYFFNYWFEKV